VSETPKQAAQSAARALYAADAASRGLGMELVDADAGVAHVRMTIRADMTNGHGICHGGFVFALADSAFAFACNSHGEPTVAAAVSIDFLAPARLGDTLTAIANEQWLGGRTGLYDIVVARPADGAVIAHARGRSHRIGKTRDQPAHKD
jgi:acyl-CoA thioesterase